MHTLLFEMKRAHLASVRLTRDLCAQVGLTPARLDMVRTIFENSNRLLQSALPARLGVSKAVVSIMVRALERLGFVRRVRPLDDRRTFVLEVLARGRIALRRIFYETVTIPLRNMAYASAFFPASPAANCSPTTYELERKLHAFRRAFDRPSATDPNPWTISEDDPWFYYGAYTDNLTMVDLVADGYFDLLDDRGRFPFVVDDDRAPGSEGPTPTSLERFDFLDWVAFNTPSASREAGGPRQT